MLPTPKQKQFNPFVAGLIGLALLVVPLMTVAQSFDPGANDNTNTSLPSEQVIITTPTDPDPIADLNSQIAAKKARVDELNQQAALYQEKINLAEGQIHDLKSQVAVIDDQIAQANFQIEAKREEISSLELEMTALQQSIDQKTTDLNAQKENLTTAILQLDKNSRISTLALVLTHDNLADFYSQAQATASLGQALEQSISQLNVLRAELQTKQDELTTARDDLQQSKAQLEVQKQSTIDQRQYKDSLLEQTEGTAGQFDALVRQAALEEQQANATISALELEVQRRISGGVDVPVFSSTGYIWPVFSRSISAYFHDADYPYERYIGPHTGLDIRTPQGTSVRATADGIVSVVHNQGRTANGASALNYVGIVHDQGISSRYLHLVEVLVYPDQFVHQGDVIGLSGGIPGTEGAGSFSSGAHLHFEVRVNGLPDDPLKYLPRS